MALWSSCCGGIVLVALKLSGGAVRSWCRAVLTVLRRHDHRHATATLTRPSATKNRTCNGELEWTLLLLSHVREVLERNVQPLKYLRKCLRINPHQMRHAALRQVFSAAR